VKRKFISVKDKPPPSGMYIGKDISGREIPVIYGQTQDGNLHWISPLGTVIEITHYAELNEKP